MSSLRQCVEWQFRAIVQTFAFLDYKKNLKLGLQPVGIYYLERYFATSCHVWNRTKLPLTLTPPTVNEYLHPMQPPVNDLT
ncbi:hypothetical protein V1509DRAFT_626787 [Lipomyces kononenkoae]